MSTTASHAGSHGDAHGTHYFVPEPSHWMIFGSAALLCMASGAATWFNGWHTGQYVLYAGLAILIFMMWH